VVIVNYDAFCVEALEEALARHGNPQIFNTDQGSQSMCRCFTEPTSWSSSGIRSDKEETSRRGTVATSCSVPFTGLRSFFLPWWKRSNEFKEARAEATRTTKH
jgi:hypothetical protein